METILLRWRSGGSAELLTLQGSTITLRSTVPFAPGSRIPASLEAFGGASFTLKMHRSKRTPEGEYLLECRSIDMTKTLREQLVSALEGHPIT